MNDADADELYGELVRLLRDLELDWIVAQVSVEVALGRIVARVPDRRSAAARGKDESPVFSNLSTVDYGRAGAVGRRSLISTEPYSPTERLQELVRAVRRVLVDASEIEKHLAQFAASELNGSSAGKLFRAAETDVDRQPLLSAGVADAVDGSYAMAIELLERLTRTIAE